MYFEGGVAQAGDPFPMDQQAQRQNNAATTPYINNRRVGQPGSKRFQRFINKAFLLQNEQDLEEEDLSVFVAPTYTALDAIFEEKNKKTWEPFVETTEGRQRKMIQSLSARGASARRHHHRQSALSPTTSFASIKASTRRLLRESEEFVPMLDKEISNFMQNSQLNSLTYTFNDDFDRLLCHAVCQYYQLSSITRESHNSKIVAIRKTPKSQIPGATLVQHMSRS